MSFAYGALASARLRRRGTRAAIPVICLGNVNLGGTGKTPACMAIAELLAEAGHRPAFLLRGYGGALPGPVIVEPDRHHVSEVGDEALLLARERPTVVARDRVAGAALCAEHGADVVVMDDGMQNPSLAKDLTIAVFDGAAGIGNGLVFPAGPLRAPLGAQLPMIDAAIVVGRGTTPLPDLADRPVLPAELVPDPEVAAALAGVRVLAAAGIGRPAKFFETLRSCGAVLLQTAAFGDHHRFTRNDAAELRSDAERRGLTVATTEKDWVRLREVAGQEGPVAAAIVLPVRLRFADPARAKALVLEAVREALSPRSSAGPARGG